MHYSKVITQTLFIVYLLHTYEASSFISFVFAKNNEQQYVHTIVVLYCCYLCFV